MEVQGILEIVKAFFAAMRNLLVAFGVLDPKPEEDTTAAANS